MRQIKKLTWLQAFILGDVGVIWCNSLRDCLFQIHVMDFVEIVIDLYVHITSHVSQAFASCTHYTSYSLLNCVHVIVCFWSDQPSLRISGNWCRTCLLVWFFFLGYWEKILLWEIWVEYLCFWKTSHLILMHFLYKI